MTSRSMNISCFGTGSTHRDNAETGSNQIRPRIFETVILAGYAVLVASAIAHHEPWADEAQAWQLARYLSLHDLFVTYLHYEVHPILWYVLLRTLNFGGFPTAECIGFVERLELLDSALPVLFAVSEIPESSFAVYLFSSLSICRRGAKLCACAPYCSILWRWRWRKNAWCSVLLGLLANVETSCGGYFRRSRGRLLH